MSLRYSVTLLELSYLPKYRPMSESTSKPKPILKRNTDAASGEATEQASRDSSALPARSQGDRREDRRGDGKGKRKGKGNRDRGQEAAPAKVNPALMRGPRPVAPIVEEEPPAEEAIVEAEGIEEEVAEGETVAEETVAEETAAEEAPVEEATAE
jgi:hypothetical protein